MFDFHKKYIILTSACVFSENTYGTLKGRWRFLYKRTECRPENLRYIIIGTYSAGNHSNEKYRQILSESDENLIVDGQRHNVMEFPWDPKWIRLCWPSCFYFRRSEASRVKNIKPWVHDSNMFW